MGFFFWDMKDVLASEALYNTGGYKAEYDINKNGAIDTYDLQWIDLAKDEHRPKGTLALVPVGVVLFIVLLAALK